MEPKSFGSCTKCHFIPKIFILAAGERNKKRVPRTSCALALRQQEKDERSDEPALSDLPKHNAALGNDVVTRLPKRAAAGDSVTHMLISLTHPKTWPVPTGTQAM